MRNQKMPGATSTAEPVAGNASPKGYCSKEGVGNEGMLLWDWVSIRGIDVNVNVKYKKHSRGRPIHPLSPLCTQSKDPSRHGEQLHDQ